MLIYKNIIDYFRILLRIQFQSGKKNFRVIGE